MNLLQKTLATTLAIASIGLCPTSLLMNKNHPKNPPLITAKAHSP